MVSLGVLVRRQNAIQGAKAHVAQREDWEEPGVSLLQLFLQKGLVVPIDTLSHHPHLLRGHSSLFTRPVSPLLLNIKVTIIT